MLAVCGAAMAQSPAVSGDVDGDGVCTTNDVTVLYNYLLYDDSSAMVAGDQDGDGYITVGDVTWVYNVLLYVSHDDEHEYIDLGLPSGTLWATMNIGASSPEDYGDYFAWGETAPKDVYDWSTYKWCNGSSNTLTKYCFNSSYGNNGFVDNLTELDPEDDAATVNWGQDWRMRHGTRLMSCVIIVQANGQRGTAWLVACSRATSTARRCSCQPPAATPPTTIARTATIGRARSTATNRASPSPSTWTRAKWARAATTAAMGKVSVLCECRRISTISRASDTR